MLALMWGAGAALATYSINTPQVNEGFYDTATIAASGSMEGPGGIIVKLVHTANNVVMDSVSITSTCEEDVYWEHNFEPPQSNWPIGDARFKLYQSSAGGLELKDTRAFVIVDPAPQS